MPGLPYGRARAGHTMITGCETTSSADGRWLGKVRGDQQALLAPVFAQARSRLTAFAYIGALLAEPGNHRSCWQLAERAGHRSPRRMQALLAEHNWDWKAALRALQRFILAYLGDPGAVLSAASAGASPVSCDLLRCTTAPARTRPRAVGGGQEPRRRLPPRAGRDAGARRLAGNMLMAGDQVVAAVDFTPFHEPASVRHSRRQYWYGVCGRDGVDLGAVAASLDAAREGRPWSATEVDVWPAMLVTKTLRCPATPLAVMEVPGAPVPTTTEARYQAVRGAYKSARRSSRSRSAASGMAPEEDDFIVGYALFDQPQAR